MRPRLLDLFCGAGGAGMGYYRAGFDVTGVDIRPMPRYPFAFVQADALEHVAQHGREYDVIHASPPCQGLSEATPMQYRPNTPNLIPDTRRLLELTGKAYVIENVENARSWLRNPVMLCGTMFDLPIWRHRYFETWPAWWLSPATCAHRKRPITVHSGITTRMTWNPVRCTGGARQGVRPRESVDVVRWAMDIDWMTQSELTEAIPPAYTEWIGTQLLEAMGIMADFSVPDLAAVGVESVLAQAGVSPSEALAGVAWQPARAEGEVSANFANFSQLGFDKAA